MKPLISVIIPTLHSLMIDKTIESLKNQTFDQPYEVIVVGLDKHNKIKEGKNIQFINTGVKKNPAEARNIGIEKAKGKYICFIDSDCIASPKLIKYLYSMYRREGSFVGGSVDYESKKFWQLCDNISHFHSQSPRLKAGSAKNIATINMIVPRRTLRDIKGFNENLATGEDLDLSMRLNKVNSLYFEPKAVIYHHPERNSFLDLIKHSYGWAVNSINIKKRGKLINSFTLAILAIPIAFSVTFRIFFIEDRYFFKHYWYTIPFVFISKLAWCVGASRGIKR